MVLWPTLRTTVLTSAAAVLLGSCAAEAPYVYTDYRFHQRGQVIVCYDDSTTKMTEIKAIADEICRQYDRTSQFVLKQSSQCSWTVPDQAIYTCVPRPGENPPPIIPHMAPMRHDAELPPP